MFHVGDDATISQLAKEQTLSTREASTVELEEFGTEPAAGGTNSLSIKDVTSAVQLNLRRWGEWTAVQIV